MLILLAQRFVTTSVPTIAKLLAPQDALPPSFFFLCPHAIHERVADCAGLLCFTHIVGGAFLYQLHWCTWLMALISVFIPISSVFAPTHTPYPIVNICVC